MTGAYRLNSHYSCIPAIEQYQSNCWCDHQKEEINQTALPFGTSLFDVRYKMPREDNIVEKDGLRLYSVPAALVSCPEHLFRQASTEVRAAMAMVKDASDVLALLLEGGHSTIAGRLAGAFRNAGRDRIADQIIRTMKTAGFTLLESDPFENKPSNILDTKEASPYVNRIRLMWQEMRKPIIERFPVAPGLPNGYWLLSQTCRRDLRH